MEISRIENLIKQTAASRKTYEENGNTALQTKQTVNEPVIPLPNAQQVT